MAMKRKERDSYVIPIDEMLIPVSKEVHHEYYRMGRRERYLEERDIKKGLLYYDAWDTAEMRGVDMFATPKSEDPAVITESKHMKESLCKEVGKLSSDEMKVLYFIYFNNLGKNSSQHEVARKMKISQPAVKKRHDKVIGKMRKLMKI